MNGGRCVASGSIDSLKKKFGRVEYLIYLSHPPPDEPFEKVEDRYLVRTEDIDQVNRLIAEKYIEIEEIRTKEPSLEEIFWRLME
ncbi:MAG: ATP-binding protein DrrA1-3 family domain-containing protein [Candidatus Syntropharchaeia archaeon]